MLKSIGSIVLLSSTGLIVLNSNLSVRAQSTDVSRLSAPPRELIYEQGPAQERMNQQRARFGPVAAQSVGLDFEAAIRSVQEFNSLPRGFISYQGLRNVDSQRYGCWMIDQRGRRIDLSAMCAR